jgi:signal peptidase II
MMEGAAPNPNTRRGDIIRIALILATLGLDQVTKMWARANYSLPDGEPDYYKVTQVIGEWVQFRLVYNRGAAFGLRPQDILPFLHPTVFYLLFSSVAILVLFFYYRKLGRHEAWPRTGVALILSGAFGNLIDRLQLHKVTDFIDVGIPGYAWRWPTFNIADSCVCVGVGLILAAPLFARKHAAEESAAGGAHAPAAGAGREGRGSERTSPSHDGPSSMPGSEGTAGFDGTDNT